jgi:hypothetical protein
MPSPSFYDLRRYAPSAKHTYSDSPSLKGAAKTGSCQISRNVPSWLRVSIAQRVQDLDLETWRSRNRIRHIVVHGLGL